MPQYQGQHDRASINQLDITLQTQHLDVGLQMITAIRLFINLLVILLKNASCELLSDLVCQQGKLIWEKAVYQSLFMLVIPSKGVFFFLSHTVCITTNSTLDNRIFC